MNILKLKISELTKFVKDHIPAVIIALIIFGSVFGFLYKNMFKEYIVLMKEKNEFEKNKITQELNIKQKEKESQGLLEANLKKKWNF